ncbi:MAG TPA: DUF3017 domain-containing protein [Candidatus Corynebacterium gallistercoris]|uniref:DUF3017 domain-containing protein n=1 Tax=Candidatus Corynebacterium gallistercoris TaxID=2838530 RepID=A0A9D1RY88_9CORY|nr:DUF3017 domain-containing protein [Candidatus Corynebacterium gallistercoris]
MKLGDARERLLANPHDVHVPLSALPPVAQKALVGLFLALLAAVVFFIGMDRWRRGTFTLGLAMVWLAVIRWLVDSRIMGVLAVRSRKFDSLFCGTVGALIIWFAVSIDPLGS